MATEVTARVGAKSVPPADFQTDRYFTLGDIATNEDIAAASDGKILTSDKAAQPLGLATLDGDGQIPIAQLPGAALNMVTDSAGDWFSPDSLPQEFAYDDDGNLETITVTDGDVVRVQTYTYEDGELTDISRWVVQ